MFERADIKSEPLQKIDLRYKYNHAILDYNTVCMCRDQLSDSSIITPRNLPSFLGSIGILDIIKGVKSLLFFDLEFIHFTRILISFSSFTLTSSIVSAVIIIFASSA